MLLATRKRFKLFFIIQYFGVGIFGPYLALYFTGKGLLGWQFGLMLGLMPLMTMVAQPAWSFISDITQSRRLLLLVACLATTITTALYVFSDSFLGLLFITTFYSLLRAPIGTLSTALLLDQLELGNEQNEFGRYRLWGSVGFSITSLLMGSFVIKDLITILPLFYSGSMLLLTLLAWSLPEGAKGMPVHWWQGITLLNGRTQLIQYLAASLFFGAAVAIGMQYLAVYMDRLNASGWLIGFAVAFQAIMEVPLMARVSKWIAQYGLSTVLLAGLVILPLRWLSYVFIEDPWLIIPTQLLHSLSIVSLMVVGVRFVDQQIPREWRATGQGLYTAMMSGVGPAVGLFVAGSIYEEGNIGAVWIMNTLITVFGLLLLAPVFYPRLSVLSRAK